MAKTYALDWHHEDRITGDKGLWDVQIIGVDEVGRGPLAGPVVAAAAVIPRLSEVPVRIADSKKLSEKQKAAAVSWIEAHAKAQLAQASVAEIDELNILHASMLAMQRAVNALAARLPAGPKLVLVDGNRIPSGLDLPAQALVKGDSLSPNIAAASIVAKVERDRLMAEMAQVYPGYGFAQHKGYPTPAHLDALRTQGPCPQHRRSFAPVAALLKLP